MQVSNIYSETLSRLSANARGIIHQGGQYSGKTVNILIALAHLANNDTTPTVTTVTSMSFPHLKGGALRDFELFVVPKFLGGIDKYHKTDHLFTFKSGSMIEFKVYPTEMDARGQKRKRLFINEANSFPWDIFFQLNSRSENTIIDYNPSIRFWAHEKMEGEPGWTKLISNHWHNPFLTEAKHKEIESLCTFQRDETTNKILYDEKNNPIVIKGDFERWKVYARGLTGNVTGIIFPNWDLIDLSDFPPDDGNEIFAIDFGYTIDPTAIVKLKLIGETLYVKELAYEPSISAKRICNILTLNGYDDEVTSLFCEHDKDMIRQIRNFGFPNAMSARKGDGSVNAGIDLLKSYKVKYWGQNLKRELSKYIWEVNKEGKTLNKPVDGNNHLIDAIRYGTYSRFVRIEQAA